MMYPQRNDGFSPPGRPNVEGDTERGHAMRQDGKAALSIFLVISAMLVLNYAFDWGLLSG